MEFATVFITLGALFLVGLAADQLGRRTRLPRVTMLLLCGAVVGKSGFDLIPPEGIVWYDALAILSLTMVAFLLGGTLHGDRLSAQGRSILWVSICIVVFTALLVSAGLWALGVVPAVAIVLGAIATATAPAATQETLREVGATGPFADLVRGIVAIDDAWAMFAFAFALIAAQALAQGAIDMAHLAAAAWEVGGALGIGFAVGLPAAFLSGRLQPGEPSQMEALGIVFLVAGFALWIEVSFLLAGMTAGAVVANRARHHERAFHEIEYIEWPFLMLFFLLAGVSIELSALIEVGFIGIAFVILRIIARLAGGWVGGAAAGLPPLQRRWIGPALLPQAGVAIGMALVAEQALPQWGSEILTLTIGTTVFFELIGPLATQQAVIRVGRKS